MYKKNQNNFPSRILNLENSSNSKKEKSQSLILFSLNLFCKEHYFSFSLTFTTKLSFPTTKFVNRRYYYNLLLHYFTQTRHIYRNKLYLLLFINNNIVNMPLLHFKKRTDWTFWSCQWEFKRGKNTFFLAELVIYN